MPSSSQQDPNESIYSYYTEKTMDGSAAGLHESTAEINEMAQVNEQIKIDKKNKELQNDSIPTPRESIGDV